MLTIGEVARSSSESESEVVARSDRADKIGDQLLVTPAAVSMTNGSMMTAITTMFGELLGDIVDDPVGDDCRGNWLTQPLVQNFFRRRSIESGNLLLNFTGGGALATVVGGKPDHRHLSGWFGWPRMSRLPSVRTTPSGAGSRMRCSTVTSSTFTRRGCSRSPIRRRNWW